MAQIVSCNIEVLGGPISVGHIDHDTENVLVLDPFWGGQAPPYWNYVMLNKLPVPWLTLISDGFYR